MLNYLQRIDPKHANHRTEQKLMDLRQKRKRIAKK